MKLALGLATAVYMVAVAAHADTITLGSKPGFGVLQEYIDVPNDAGVRVDIYPAVVIIDGVSYPTGSLVSVNLNVTTYRSCTGSGRGQHCSTHYTLISGTIVR